MAMVELEVYEKLKSDIEINSVVRDDSSENEPLIPKRSEPSQNLQQAKKARTAPSGGTLMLTDGYADLEASGSA